MSIAARIRELRQKSGESLQQLAESVGASKAHLSDLERGAATNPTIELLRALAAHYNVSIAALIGEEPAPAVPVVNDQVNAWIKQIRKEQAAGLDLETAAQEARLTFEGLMGPLDAQQIANWNAARDEIARTLQQKIEFLGTYSIRKPRRPEWYAGPKETDANWPRLRAYLLERKKWSQNTVDSIDSTSSEVVGLLENPAQSEFRGRGMVVGYVQSGKTANMTAVIAKAIDAGYKFVIVLTGLTNSLRKQTQVRLVSDLRDRNRHSWFLHTNEDADFRTPPNAWFTVMDEVQLAVVKKNVSPLEHLLETIRKTPPALRERMPVLLIDDECDQAGVNASGSQYNMTTINGLIRRILALLPRVQYVGYTATPFANVLINPEKPAGGLDDLYPEDFITPLPRPEGYFGTETLFGRDPIDADAEKPDETGLDMIREVPAEEMAQVRPPSAREKDLFDPSIPPSLGDALRYFLLATACRYARGARNQHSSMLIHTTVYKRPHEKMAFKVEAWLREVGSALASGDTGVLDGLRSLWEAESAKVDPAQFGNKRHEFDEVEPHLRDVISDLEVIVENSDSDTRLDFSGKGKKYIVVGGSVLARGLTIEGLIVSYFVRTSSQYDTLLQMGRWFGYRIGYEDLPRIWMTKELQDAFHDLATVEAEIRADMEEYRRRDVTPADFAVRIRQIPDMTITAAKKMIAAESCDISFSGEHLQTIRFHVGKEDGGRLASNWNAGVRLVDAAATVSAVEPRTNGPTGRLFRQVPLEAVTAFLKDYKASDRDLFSQKLLDYIMTAAARADAPFRFWNVGVIEPESGSLSAEPLGALGKVRTVNRARLKETRADGAADIKALMSRRDVLLDVSCTAASDKWKALKAARQSEIGDKIPLLLLYAIDANSKPRDEQSTIRVPLQAPMDVLGVGIVFPDRGLRTSYVRVQLSPDDAEGESLSAELPAEGTGGDQ